jgi:hypothetical protein
MKRGTLKRFIEFLIIGVLFGVTEDVIAVALTTDAEVSIEMIGLILLIAIPFAAISELIVDHPDFLHFEKLASRLQNARTPES